VHYRTIPVALNMRLMALQRAPTNLAFLLKREPLIAESAERVKETVGTILGTEINKSVSQIAVVLEVHW